MLEVCENYEQISTVMLTGEQKTPRFVDRFNIQYTPPDYFTPASFLNWVDKALREASGPTARIVFNGIDQLISGSPIFAKEPMLVAALVELFKSVGATCLFLGSESPALYKGLFDARITIKTHEEPGNTICTYECDSVEFPGSLNSTGFGLKIEHNSTTLSITKNVVAKA